MVKWLYKMQVCKPGSVPFRALIIYLSDPPVLTAQGSGSGSQIQNLFDLTTRKVFHACFITKTPVSSYLTFSPFPNVLPPWVVCFLWHCLVYKLNLANPSFQKVRHPVVARTFLPFIIERSMRRPAKQRY